MRQPAERHGVTMPVRALALGVAYVLLALFCDVFFRFGTHAIAVFWIPSALSLAFFWRTRPSGWPLLAIALYAGAALEASWLGFPAPVVLGWAVGVILEPLISVTLLRRLDVSSRLLDVRDVLLFVAIAALLAPMSGGIVGATIASLFLRRPWTESWLNWWVSGCLGVVLVAPLLLVIGVRRRGWRWTTAGTVEMTLLVTATAAFAWLWSREPVGSVLVLTLPTLITVPLLSWGALRFGLKGAAAVSVTAATIVSWNAAQGFGPFVGPSPEMQVLAAQSFLGVLSIGGMILAATLEQFRRAAAAQHLLADIGALLAEEDDDEEAMAGVVDRIVATFADGAAVALCAEDEPRHLVAARHRQADRERALSTAVIAEGKALGVEDLFAHCPGEAEDEETLHELRETLGPDRLVLPLRGDHHVAGVLLLVGVGAEAHERQLAEELARRCSMALEASRLRREQELAIRSRDDFLAIASHELKTPLTPLLLQLARIARGVESGASIKPEWIARARLSGLRLAALIDDLLDAGKIASGRLALRREATPLEPMLRDVAATFSTASPRHQIALRLPEEPVPVLADRFRLEQVLANLVDNAIKYSPLGGTVTIGLDVHDDVASISVSDEGIGIPADQQVRLFDRFFRARNSPSQFFGGLGLGLFICRDIVERHGGRIWVESAPGEGSTFHVDLPVYQGELASRERPREGESLSPAELP